MQIASGSSLVSGSFGFSTYAVISTSDADRFASALEYLISLHYGINLDRQYIGEYPLSTLK